eukprot:3317644-Rhodomonas_salina.1
MTCLSRNPSHEQGRNLNQRLLLSERIWKAVPGYRRTENVDTSLPGTRVPGVPRTRPPLL